MFRTIQEEEMEMELARHDMDRIGERHNDMSVSDVMPSDPDDVERYVHSTHHHLTQHSEVLSSSYYDNTSEISYTDYSDDADEETSYDNTMEQRHLQVVEQECWQIISELRQPRSMSPVLSETSAQVNYKENWN